MAGQEGWSWTTGGCFAFAEAFQAAFGGELYGVCTKESWDDGDGEEFDYPVGHAIVLFRGKFYDYDGEFDPATIKSHQAVMAKSDDHVSWFVDEFFDDGQMRTLAEIMRQCAMTTRSEVVRDPAIMGG